MNPHQNQPVATTGTPLENATSAMILVHGRGATAESVLDLARLLAHDGMAYLAPQAQGNTWYPNSFLAPIAANEPGITSGLAAIEALVGRVEEAGISADKLVIGGFSQGACLASEFAARNPRRYGGLLVFSGGVIGPLGMERDDSGNIDGTPVFLGCSDRDAHIPLERVMESAEIFRQLNGNVNAQIYPNMGHTIIHEEIRHAQTVLATL